MSTNLSLQNSFTGFVFKNLFHVLKAMNFNAICCLAIARLGHRVQFYKNVLQAIGY